MGFTGTGDALPVYRYEHYTCISRTDKKIPVTVKNSGITSIPGNTDNTGIHRIYSRTFGERNLHSCSAELHFSEAIQQEKKGRRSRYGLELIVQLKSTPTLSPRRVNYLQPRRYKDGCFIVHCVNLEEDDRRECLANAMRKEASAQFSRTLMICRCPLGFRIGR